MDWNELQSKCDKYNSEISRLQIEINKFNEELKTINQLKESLNVNKKTIKDKIQKHKLTLIQLSKVVNEELTKLKAKKLNYILSKGSLTNYEEGEDSQEKLESIQKIVSKKQKSFKEMMIEKEKILAKENLLEGNSNKLSSDIRNNKNQINSLQQFIANICMNDEVLEFVQLDKNKYKLIIKHSIFNLKTKAVIENEKDYFYGSNEWYLCRENRSDKKIRNKKKISNLTELLNEKIK